LTHRDAGRSPSRPTGSGASRYSAEVDRNYVDTHGQSLVAFAFSYLLGFNLLPRLKRIGAARLNRPGAGTACRGRSWIPS
jgi:TnpA family transposase